MGRDFGFYPMLITSRKNQQTSLGAGVLDCRAHERIDQLLQDDLARYRFRDLDHGPEVKVFHRLRDRGWRVRRRGLIAQLPGRSHPAVAPCPARPSEGSASRAFLRYA